jgi:hypothetical protein
MTALQRNPVGVSVAVIAALMAVLVGLSLTVPMSVNAEHFSGHLAIGVPLLLLLILVVRTWPRPGSEWAARLARGTLLAGLGVAGLGVLIEGVGAFGYTDDGSGRANGLADLHAVGVAVWPVGFVLLLVGMIMTVGVLVATRRGPAGSRIATATAILAVAAAVSYVAGAFIFGY